MIENKIRLYGYEMENVQGKEIYVIIGEFDEKDENDNFKIRISKEIKIGGCGHAKPLEGKVKGMLKGKLIQGSFRYFVEKQIIEKDGSYLLYCKCPNDLKSDIVLTGFAEKYR